MCQKQYNTKNKGNKGKHLNYTEKTQIERWYNIDHRKCSEIAKLLGRSTRTIQREIKRGSVLNLTTDYREKYVYSADVSQQVYEFNKTGKGPNIKLGDCFEIAKFIEHGIKHEKKSPEVLINMLKRNSGKHRILVCARTIRNYIRKGILDVKPNQMIYPRVYKEKNKEKTHCDKVPAEKSIDFRPEAANDRSEYGHWEGDLILSKDGKGAALFTLVERLTRETIIYRIPSKHAKNVAKVLDELEKKYKKEFYTKFKTITFDNGGEFRNYEALEKSCDRRRKKKRVEVYYAHPYRSGERGSNENTNRLVRRFLPKKTILSRIAEEFIQYIENWINNLLRPMFDYKSSLEVRKAVVGY